MEVDSNFVLMSSKITLLNQLEKFKQSSNKDYFLHEKNRDYFLETLIPDEIKNTTIMRIVRLLNIFTYN